jgi:ketosteroid isomerase-like protein
MSGRQMSGSDLNGLTLVALALAVVAMALVPGKMQTRQQTPQQIFSPLIHRYCQLWNAAAKADDPDKVAGLYAKDPGLVFYDLEPYEYHGWSEYRQGVKTELLDKMMSLDLKPGKDLEAKEKDSVAWTTVTLHVGIVWQNGHRQNFDARHTAVWEKRGERWLIVHEHMSEPLPAPGPLGN